MKSKIISWIAGVFVGMSIATIFVYRMQLKALEKANTKTLKFKQYYNTLNQWLNNKEENKNAADFFKNKGYKTVAIYGMGELGTRLYNELKGKEKEVKVKYVIDQSIDYLNHELKVVSPEDVLEEVDIIVVTPTFAYEEIKNKLKTKNNCPIISIDEVLYGLN